MEDEPRMQDSSERISFLKKELKEEKQRLAKERHARKSVSTEYKTKSNIVLKANKQLIDKVKEVIFAYNKMGKKAKYGYDLSEQLTSAMENKNE